MHRLSLVAVSRAPPWAGLLPERASSLSGGSSLSGPPAWAGPVLWLPCMLLDAVASLVEQAPGVRPSLAAAKRLLILGPSCCRAWFSRALRHQTCSPQAQCSCHVGLVGPSWTRMGSLPMHWPMDLYRLHHQQSPYILFLYNIFVEFVHMGA